MREGARECLPITANLLNITHCQRLFGRCLQIVYIIHDTIIEFLKTNTPTSTAQVLLVQQLGQAAEINKANRKGSRTHFVTDSGGYANTIVVVRVTRSNISVSPHTPVLNGWTSKQVVGNNAHVCVVVLVEWHQKFHETWNSISALINS